MRRRWAVILAAGWALTALAWFVREVDRLPRRLDVLTVRRSIPTSQPSLTNDDARRIAHQALDAAGFPPSLWIAEPDDVYARDPRSSDRIFIRDEPGASSGVIQFHNAAADHDRDRSIFVRFDATSSAEVTVTVSRGK